MSLTVPTAVLDAAERGPIDDAVFLDVIRTSALRLGRRRRGSRGPGAVAPVR